MKDAQLTALRGRIDTVNERLVAMMNERAELAKQVGALKGDGLIYVPAREQAVLRQVVAANKGPLADKEVRTIFKEVIAACRNLEDRLRVFYLGPAGTYSEVAAQQHLGRSCEFVPCASLDEVLERAADDERAVAVLPIENSTEGGVSQTLDLLLKTSLNIVGETDLAIRHQLLSQAARLEDITEVMAHPQALAQCRRWLTAMVPQAKQTPTESNAAAAQQAAERPSVAAIASRQAAQLYKLPIVATAIADSPQNTTRFVVLGSQPVASTGSDKTSLACSMPNQPGSLNKLTNALAEAEINITKLESRPSPTGLWNYVFYLDLDGHLDDPHVAAAVGVIHQHALSVKVLGSYPKAAP